MKKILTILILLLSYFTFSQNAKITTKSKLVIKHKDMTLYLQSDTNTMVSVHNLTYANFKLIGKIDRKKLGDKWFVDVYKGKFKKKYYAKTGYDLGHLTPFKITSYSDTVARNSFSCYNQAPQMAKFNEHPWEQIEEHVLDSIKKYKANSVIITGVIYDNSNPVYLNKSRIKIPTHYYKIVKMYEPSVGRFLKYYALIGDNKTGEIKKITIEELNNLFILNKMDLSII